MKAETLLVGLSSSIGSQTPDPIVRLRKARVKTLTRSRDLEEFLAFMHLLGYPKRLRYLNLLLEWITRE